MQDYLKKFKGALITFFVFSFLLISSCQGNVQTISKPTPEFYINDNAKVLLQSTKWYIYTNGKEYYKDNTASDVNKDIQGVQIVVATYQGEVGSINTTDIFNKYGVGKNDLGVMLFLFFHQDEGTKEKIFDDIVVEIGIKMSNYLSAFEVSELVDLFFYDEGLIGNVDTGIFNLYYVLIEITANRIYQWDEDFVYEFYLNYDDYLAEQYTFTKPLPSEERPFGVHLETWQMVLIGVVLLLLIIFGRRSGFLPLLFYSILGLAGRSSSKGGGGKSGGYWFRR